MDSSTVVVILVVVTALAFDFTNGFHDTANAMATSIATRALPPKVAVGIASVLNFVGAFLSLNVAATIAKDIVRADAITPAIVLAGLLGGIFWNLITWRLSIPSSSSHALIGGVVGAVVIASGFDAVLADGVFGEVIIPAVLAPIIAFLVAGTATFLVYRWVGGRDGETTKRSFKIGQIASASLVALAHGTNDAQKTMGVITLALIANGTIASSDPSTPLWVIVAAALAISLGTYIGGWRIIRTLGKRVTEIETPQGFSAETSSAAVILAASQAGYPLSTTHITSGGVMGAGAGKRLAGVQWGVVGQMATAWILTLPAAALIAAGFYLVSEAVGTDLGGPLVIAVGGAILAGILFYETQKNAPISSADV